MTHKTLLENSFSVYGVISEYRVTRKNIYFTLVNYDHGKTWQRHCIVPYHLYTMCVKKQSDEDFKPISAVDLRTIDNGWYALVTFDNAEKAKDYLIPKKQRKASYYVSRCVVGSSTDFVLNKSL